MSWMIALTTVFMGVTEMESEGKPYVLAVFALAVIFIVVGVITLLVPEDSGVSMKPGQLITTVDFGNECDKQFVICELLREVVETYEPASLRDLVETRTLASMYKGTTVLYYLTDEDVDFLVSHRELDLP